jgi:ankyrin repeat protein
MIIRIFLAFVVSVLPGLSMATEALQSDRDTRPSRTPAEELIDAAASGDLTSVRRLLDSQVNVNANAPRSQATALHQAAAGGHLVVLNHLLERGARVDSEDGDGANALVYAAYHGRFRAVTALFAANANIQHVPARQVHALNAAMYASDPAHP